MYDGGIDTLPQPVRRKCVDVLRYHSVWQRDPAIERDWKTTI
jgi:hypothetical protein